MSLKKIIQSFPFGPTPKKKKKKKKKKKRPIRILSIDGGGIRGIVPAMILHQIEQITGQPTCELFDFIAGTSAGGMVALLLVKPDKDGTPEYTAQEVAEIFAHRGSEIFSSTVWDQIRSVRTLREKKYPSTGIEKILKDHLGETYLSESLTDILITSYAIKRRNACFFKSRNAVASSDFNIKMRHIARATSAAPTYFEPAQVDIPNLDDPFVLIDGGIVANNPAMCAYVEARSLYPKADDFIVVSIGTGELLQGYDYDDAKRWGLAGWVGPMIDFLFHGSQVTVDYQLQQLLPPNESIGQRYYRFQFPIENGMWGLDDTRPTNIQRLKEIVTEQILKDEERTILELCKKLKR